MTAPCTCGRAGELEATNVRLRRVLYAAAPAVLRAGLGLRNDTLASMLWRMYRQRPGEWTPLYDLELDLSGDRMSDINVVRTYVHRLRADMGGDPIETEAGSGYRLTAEGRAAVARALGET